MTSITTKQSAIEAVADRLKVDKDTLKNTLKATVFKAKCTDGAIRPANDDEFLALMIVADTYQLNPITKELYAFPQKGGGIVPIVSTDGWTRLMTTHPKYKTHSFRYSEKVVSMPKAKPCPEWCEIDIEKVDGSHVIVREYLDEVFRDLNYDSAWQSHTKRMLRHKTKIQGAREAFGFSGIYDEDEGERIIEVVDTPKPEPAMPKRLSAKTTPAQEVLATAQPEAKNEVSEPTIQAQAAEILGAKPADASEPPIAEGFKLIKATRNGLCKGACGSEVKEGSDVYFNPKRGTYHDSCVPRA